MNYNYKNKEQGMKALKNYLYSKTITMFDYSGLDDIPNREIERLLQSNGYVFIFKNDDKLIATSGSLGGELDEYGNATIININIPYLKINKTLSIDDGVLIYNDSTKQGLEFLFNRSCFMLVENDINFILSGYAGRTQKFISASDDKTQQSAERLLERSIEGELAIIGENAIFEGVKMHSSSQANNSLISGLIQYAQYIKSTLYNELGIATAEDYHKKANLLKDEVEQTQELVFPLVYNMLQCRQEGIENLNKKFNLNAGVSFNSIWAIKYGKQFNTGAEKMLLSEYLTSGSLWGAIKDKSKGLDIEMLLSEFDTNKLDRQMTLLYGNKELFSNYNDSSIDEIAELIILTQSEKWLNLQELKNLKLGTVGKETLETTINKEITSENTDKISVDNEDTLIEDKGQEQSETGIENQTQEIIKQDFSIILQQLTQADKLSIVNILLSDVSKFLTLSIY